MHDIKVLFQAEHGKPEVSGVMPFAIPIFSSVRVDYFGRQEVRSREKEWMSYVHTAIMKKITRSTQDKNHSQAIETRQPKHMKLGKYYLNNQHTHAKLHVRKHNNQQYTKDHNHIIIAPDTHS